MSLQETLHRQHLDRRLRWAVAGERQANQGQPTPKLIEEVVELAQEPVVPDAALVQSTPEQPQRRPRPTVAQIQQLVATDFQIRVIDIVSARRTADVILPRQIAMYLSKSRTLMSFPQIGKKFGGRDHTTVLHGVRKIEALLSTDPPLNEKIETLTARLRESFDID